MAMTRQHGHRIAAAVAITAALCARPLVGVETDGGQQVKAARRVAPTYVVWGGTVTFEFDRAALKALGWTKAAQRLSGRMWPS